MRLTTPRARRPHPLSYRIYKKISDMGATKIYIHTYTHIHTRIHLGERIRLVFWSRVVCALKRAHPILTFDSISISKIAFGAQRCERRSDESVRRHTGSTFADPRVHLSFPDNAIVPLEARGLRLVLVEPISKRDAIDGRFHDDFALFCPPLSPIRRHFTILFIDYVMRVW